MNLPDGLRSRKAALVLVVLVLLSGLVVATSHTWETQGSVTWESPDGPSVSTTGTIEGTTSTPITQNEVDFGDVSFQSDSPTSLTASGTGEDTTSLSNIDTNGTTISVSDSTKQDMDLSGSITAVDYKAANVSSSETEFTVTGDGSGTLDVHGLSPSTSYVIERSSGDEGGQTDGSGVLSISTSSGTDEISITSANAPVLSNATPSGGATANETPFQLQVDVNDADFGSAGDSVTVTFYDAEDDSQIGTDTLTSNGTASTDWDGLELGSASWYAVAEDDYGASVQSGPHQFNTYSEIEIRNESNPDELVSGPNATATVQFFNDDGDVYERETNTGTLNMSGLPNDRFVIQVEIDGFVTRQAIIDNIAEQQTVYVLPENATTVESRFRLSDPTGQFTEQTTTLYIEKPITRNGSTSYEVVAADEFGANGYTATLEEGARYRLRVRSQDGAEQVVGTYTPTQSEVVTVEIEELEFEFGGEDLTYQWGAFWDDENDEVEFTWADGNATSDYVEVTIYERGNESNVIEDGRYTSTDSLQVTAEVPAEYNSSSWVVEWEARHDGEIITGTDIVGKAQMPLNLSGLPDNVKHLISILAVFVVAGLFSVGNVEVGAGITVIFSGFLLFIGWMPPATSGGLIGLALFLVVLSRVARARGAGI